MGNLSFFIHFYLQPKCLGFTIILLYNYIHSLRCRSAFSSHLSIYNRSLCYEATALCGRSSNPGLHDQHHMIPVPSMAPTLFLMLRGCDSGCYSGSDAVAQAPNLWLRLWRCDSGSDAVAQVQTLCLRIRRCNTGFDAVTQVLTLCSGSDSVA
jgi:hypothetical protein